MYPFVLAQQSGAAQPGVFELLLPFVLVVGIFYLLIIRPMRSRQKNLETLITSLKKGDKVITNGGIYGTIAQIKDETFLIRINEQVKMEIAKNAVASLQSTSESTPSK